MSYHSSGDIRKLISAISHTKRKKCVCFGGGRGGGEGGTERAKPLDFPYQPCLGNPSWYAPVHNFAFTELFVILLCDLQT